MTNDIKPIKIRLDASTLCQLECPLCPRDALGENIGFGFLKFDDFKNVLDSNPWVSDIELSNYGEIFLNPDLLEIIMYAYSKNVTLHADNGVNLNTASDEVLEALVKYKFRSLKCSIDGVDQETYSIYRKSGNFEKVIQHIKKINYYKEKLKSAFPLLTWQFIVFGHNTHQIKAARQTAKNLSMLFRLRLSWDDSFSPVINKDLVRHEFGLDVSSRQEYIEKTGKDYVERICTQLWLQPQINFDGKVLGCCVNHWGNFGNIFQEGLSECLNNEKINYARAMLSGCKESRQDIPCSTCKYYKLKRKNGTWVSLADVEDSRKKASFDYI